MSTIDEKADTSGSRKKMETISMGSASTAIANEIIKPLDFGDLKTEWSSLLQKTRLDAESTLLKVTTRITKLDPIAELALAKIKKLSLENFDEAALRKLIAESGLATELDRVIKRINGLRMSENKRVVLAAVYSALLYKLLKTKDGLKAAKDEIGFVDEIMFELEKKDGPLDRFAEEIVELVGAKHRINFTDDNVLRDLVAHQVRAAL